MSKSVRLFTGYGFFFILSIGIVLRVYGLDTWSLWEDEEATLYYSENPNKPFPQFFPFFFRILHWILSITGESVVWGRFPAAVFGTLSIWVTYFCVQKYFSKRAALIASFLLAINLGHIFWSQSIRYYSTVYFFLQISIYFFLDGFENDRPFSLLWSNCALFIGTITHSSAILIVPVYMSFLFYIKISRDETIGYCFKNYILYGLFLSGGLSFFIYNTLLVHKTMSAIVIPSAMDPVHIMKTFFAYFGFPVMILGGIAMGMFLLNRKYSREFVFFSILAVLPVLQLIVIAGNTSVTWYHGFISLNGFVVISAVYITFLVDGGFHKIGACILTVTVCYYTLFLGFYYTSSFGGRPRWEEACLFVKKEAGINDVLENNPDIFATAPGVVAYYLGVPSDHTMGHPLVKRLGFSPPHVLLEKESWFLVKSNYLTTDYNNWLKETCSFEKKITSKIGPFDRWSILIYRKKDTIEPSKGGQLL